MRFSVLIEIYCGFAFMGNFLCGFSVSYRHQCPPPYYIELIRKFSIDQYTLTNFLNRGEVKINCSQIGVELRCYFK